MMKIRPGVILINICEENILVASYDARQYCPYTMILNETGAVIWRCISKHETFPEIIRELKSEFDIPSGTDIEGAVNEYLDRLHSNGYLMYAEDKEI